LAWQISAAEARSPLFPGTTEIKLRYTPADIVSAGGTVAAPVKSLYQTDAIGLKTTLWATWGLRAAGHCQFLTGATW